MGFTKINKGGKHYGITQCTHKDSWQERINRREEKIVEQHRKAMQEELKEEYEGLDAYHLKKVAREVLNEQQYEEFQRLAWGERLAEALHYHNRLLPADEKHKEELESFKEYLDNNNDGLSYHKKQSKEVGLLKKQ